MKFCIYFFFLTVFATQIYADTAAEENVATQTEPPPAETSETTVATTEENAENCTGKIVYVEYKPPKKYLIPELACLANIMQLLLAIPMKSLDFAFVSVVLYRVGYYVIAKLAHKHLEVASLLETVGLGVNNVLSSAVGGLFGIVGMGEVAKVPLKLISETTNLGLNIVSNTVGRVPIVGNILTSGLNIISSPFRG